MGWGTEGIVDRGNYLGQAPYVTGSQCSMCPRDSTCVNGLCKFVNTNVPTSGSSTNMPTKSPTGVPTLAPSTKMPTIAVTKAPTSASPTNSQSTKSPTLTTTAPLVSAPTNSPSAVTNGPSTINPTASPTTNPQILNFISASSSVSLRIDQASRQYFAFQGGILSPIILQNGSLLFENSFNGLRALALSTMGSMNMMIWKDYLQNRIHNWTLDKSWKCVSIGGFFQPESLEVYNFEFQSNLDLNSDGKIGSPNISSSSLTNPNFFSVVFQSNDIILQEQDNFGSYFILKNSSLFPVIYNGTQLRKGQLCPKCKPIAISSLAQNKILWLNEDAGEINDWNMTSGWVFTSPGKAFKVNSFEATALAKQFNVDLSAYTSKTHPETEEEGLPTLTLVMIIIGLVACLSISGYALYRLRKWMNVKRKQNEAFKTTNLSTAFFQTATDRKKHPKNAAQF